MVVRISINILIFYPLHIIYLCKGNRFVIFHQFFLPYFVIFHQI